MMEKLLDNTHYKHLGIVLGFIVLSTCILSILIYIHKHSNAEIIEASEWMSENTPQGSFTIKLLPDSRISMRIINDFSHRLDAIIGDIKFFSNTAVGRKWNTALMRIEANNAIQSKVCANEFIINSVKYDVSPDYIWINKDSPDYTNREVYCDDFGEPQFVTVYENKSILVKKVEYIKRCNCLTDGL